MKIVNIYIFSNLTKLRFNGPQICQKCHLADYTQTQTQTQTEPELFGMHFTFCNNSGTVHEFARSALKLVLLDSHKAYRV